MNKKKSIFSVALIGMILVAFPLISVLMSKMGMERGKDLRKGLGDYRFEPVGTFSLVDQTGKPFDRAALRGKVAVAGFFSDDRSEVGGRLIAQLQKIQREFIEEEDLLLLSFSLFPDQDSSFSLRKKSLSYGADSSRWHLLTGEKEILMALIDGDLHFSATQDPSLLGDWPSTRYFALLDTAGRVRNFYDGTNDAEVLRMVEHIALLVPKDHSRRLETR